MKNTRISILALSVMAGGVIAASAVTGSGDNGYYDTQALDYPLNGVFPGTPTNIIGVDSMPVAVGQDIHQNGGSFTDGAGKIAGSEYVVWYRSGPGNRTNNYAVFATDVTGNVSTKGSGPQVKMKVKGNGYYLDGAGVYSPGSTMNLTVTGSGLSQTIPAETLTYSNATPDVVEVYYTDYKLPGQTFTNFVEPTETLEVSNDARFDMPATISGTIKLNKGTTIKWDKNTAAKFSSAAELWTWNATTRTFSLVANGGGLSDVSPLEISAQVIQPAGKNAKLYFSPSTAGSSSSRSMLTGKGSVNDKKGTYTANLKGVGLSKGSQLNMKGSLGPSFVDYAFTTNATPMVVGWTNDAGAVKTGFITNTYSGVTEWIGYAPDPIRLTNDSWATNIVLGAIKTIEAQGKIMGQKVPKSNGLNVGAKSPDPLVQRYSPPDGPNVAGQTGAVVLGSAGTYAVLAGTTVTSTGATTVNGNLGVSPGTAVTGFYPPGTVNGAIHAGDVDAAQAQADLTVAYLNAAGRTVGAVTKAGNLGGQTLTPGLYKSTSSLEISSGDLTLDALGDTNAVFIFQMASTLTTTSGRQVILSGGAKAANIFWQVGSSATLGTTSVFEGNILALQSITAATGATVGGRLLAINGAVTLDANVITVPSP